MRRVHAMYQRLASAALLTPHVVQSALMYLYPIFLAFRAGWGRVQFKHIPLGCPMDMLGASGMDIYKGEEGAMAHADVLEYKREFIYCGASQVRAFLYCAVGLNRLFTVRVRLIHA